MASPDRGMGTNRSSFGAALRAGASILALCALAAGPAYAQTAPDPTDDESEELEPTAGQVQGSDEASAPETSISVSTDPTEPSGEAPGGAIIVTGIRQSLANSQNIKRNADTVVDAITAEDIGALPDRSVTEALQRVPGVSINRFAGSNDPDHFSAEGSGVVVRGLSFVRSEFNGRDAFHTGVYGQAIGWADMPAELLGSVEVYKNSTAEMIEGGLSGTINLNLRRPFDNKGFHIGANLEFNYSDLADAWSPVMSFLASNTWETGAGRFGILGAVSYSQVLSRSDGIQVTNFQLRNGTYSDVNSSGTGTGVCRAPLPSSTDTTGFPPVVPSDGNAATMDPCYGAAPAGANGFADFLPLAYAPLGGQFRTQDYDRRRRGYAAAFQWESLDRRALLTASFLRADATQKWGEHTFESAPDLSEYNTFPVGCHQNGNNPGGRPRAQCRINSSGEFFYAGNDRGNGYLPNASATYPNYQYDENGVFESGIITLPGTGWRTASSGSATTQVPTGGVQQSLSRRQVYDRNIVQDHGINLKFAPTDRWAFNFDAQYVKAKKSNLDFSVFGSTFADQELDLTGELPVLIPRKPFTLSATWAAPNPAMAAQTDEEYFRDPRWTFWRAAMDHIEESRGKEWAFRGDGQYNFLEDVPFLRRAKFGARWSDRDQKVKFTTYNWGALSEVWQGSSPVFMNEAISAGQTEFFEFDNFMRGQTPGPVGGHYYNGNLLGDYEGSSAYFGQIAALWESRGGSTGHWLPLAQRAGVVAGTPFLPADIQPVSEENRAGYLMLSFGSDDPIFGGVTLDGNIGIRYVDTRVESSGAIGVPSQQTLGVTQPFATRCAPTIPPPPAPQVPTIPGGVCNLGPAGYAALQTWATGETVADTARNTYDYWLPSLNMKFGLAHNVILRFAASRNMARAGLNEIRNYLTIGGINTNSGTLNLQATAGNPFLKPAISDNYDASLEWYFARVGSLTLNGFIKDVHNMFYQSIITREIENNGVIQTVNIRGPANFEGTGKIRGFELAYQHTFDFLPGVLSGFGVNANYTYIWSKGLPQQATFRAETSPLGVQGNLPFEQISKHNANLAVFYEKGPVSVRAAYNWRSRFLLTAADVIFPYFPIYNDETGTLDGSAFYSINDRIKIGVQGVNLTNEVTKTLQQFSLDGLIGPRSYFMNDRRFAFIVRGSF